MTGVPCGGVCCPLSPFNLKMINLPEHCILGRQARSLCVPDVNVGVRDVPAILLVLESLVLHYFL